MDLTLKQEKFSRKYAKTGNGTQTALEVYNTTDYNTAGVIAHENLNKPKIKQRIAELIDAQEGGSDEDITARLIQRAKQTEDLSNANRADDILLRLKGRYPDKKNEKGFTVEQFIKKLK